MIRRRTSPPLVIQVAIAIVAALALRALGWAPDAHAPQQAFWPLVIMIASAVWKGVEVAARVTLAALSWSVKVLWLFATQTWNGLKAVGGVVQRGLKLSWEFLRTTYNDVLKPAWKTFWRWYDRFKGWLDRTFAPVLKFLHALRTYVLDFYKTYIRPWVDLIDITRHALRILSSLGIQWARALDARLAQIEAAVQRPFQLALAKINELVNVVNRVVTFDGLLQRAALVRSIVRDYKYTTNVWWHAVHKPADPADAQRLAAPGEPKTPQQHEDEFRRLLTGDAGHTSVVLEEHLVDLRLLLRSLRP